MEMRDFGWLTDQIIWKYRGHLLKKCKWPFTKIVHPDLKRNPTLAKYIDYLEGFDFFLTSVQLIVSALIDLLRYDDDLTRVLLLVIAVVLGIQMACKLLVACLPPPYDQHWVPGGEYDPDNSP
jgi:hypothetical protein